MQNLWQRIYCQATRKNVNGAAALQMKAWHDTSRKRKARLRDKCSDEQTSRPKRDSESRFECRSPKKALVEVQVFSVLALWATYVRGWLKHFVGVGEGREIL